MTSPDRAIGAALADAARRLAASSDTPRLDAELLMAHALGIGREALLLGRTTDEPPPAFAALVDRRAGHEPIAYITGTRAFWTIELAVTPATLIPRPDSETLIEAAVAHFCAAGPARILDLGTGSGALLLAALAEWPAATGRGVDCSDAAIAVARANAARLGLDRRATIAPGGWEWAGDGGFDLVLCNPPYVAEGAALPPDVAGHEPHTALFAGIDGLDAYRAISGLLALPPRGVGCFEVGVGQSDRVAGLFARRGFATALRHDLAGHGRCVVVTAA